MLGSNLLKIWVLASIISFIRTVSCLSAGDGLPVSCISRNIDTGEHKFDDQKNIIYLPFPTCKETQKPLEVHFMADEVVNCTFKLLDEDFHLFQMYIHQDVPWSCRVSIPSTKPDVKKPQLEKEPLEDEEELLDDSILEDEEDSSTLGYNVSLPLNLNAELHESHLKIDPHLELVFLASAQDTSSSPSDIRVKSGIGFGTGEASKLKRYVIDDEITMELSIHWYPKITAYQGDKSLYYYCFMTFAATFTVAILLFLAFISKRRKLDYSKLE